MVLGVDGVFHVVLHVLPGILRPIRKCDSDLNVCEYRLTKHVIQDAPKKGAPISGAGYGALVMVYLFAAAFQFGWGPVCWIYSSEIATQRLRGLLVSYAAATQWVFNLAVARATPVMLDTVGGSSGYGTYFIYGSFCFAIAVGAFFLVPETKGLSLERMDELFGMTDFSNIQDIGVASKSAKGDIEAIHVEVK